MFPLPDTGLTGFRIETYENISDFRHKFAKQLQLCLSKNEYLQRLVSSVSDKEAPNDLGTVLRKPAYNLSEDAKTLLKAAAARDDGTILKMAYMGGRVIQAGGKSFGGDRGREAAKWESALDELESTGLVVARGYKSLGSGFGNSVLTHGLIFGMAPPRMRGTAGQTLGDRLVYCVPWRKSK